METKDCSFCKKKEDKARLINLKSNIDAIGSDLAAVARKLLNIPVGVVLICAFSYYIADVVLFAFRYSMDSSVRNAISSSSISSNSK